MSGMVGCRWGGFCALSVAMGIAMTAVGQEPPEALLPLPTNPVREEERIAEQSTELPIELKTFFEQIVGTKADEVVEESELEEILNRFEYQFRVLIPDRDVLLTSNLTTKQLVEALQSRLEKTPNNASNLPDALIPINGGIRSSWDSLKPFQRRDMSNNPSQMLTSALRMPGLDGGADDYYSSNGSLNFAKGLGYPQVKAEDVVGRAMLDIRPDIGDPVAGDELSRIRASTDPITRSEYNLIKAKFLQMPSKQAYRSLGLPERDLAVATTATDRFEDDWFDLRVAVYRRYQEAATQKYSNGRPRFNSRGRELYPNGRPKADDQGRPLYSNGHKRFDDVGRPLHSNGRPKYSSSGVPLYANGQVKKSASGRGLFRSGGEKQSDRGVPLYENGQPRIAEHSGSGSVRIRLPDESAASGVIEQIGVPISPDGQRQIAEDGRPLYENGRPVVNDEGVPLHRNQVKRLSPDGKQQFDNARNMENARGEALTYESATIAGTIGFQGRASGIFPVLSIEWVFLDKVVDNKLFVRQTQGRENLEFSLEGAFVGGAGEATPTSDPAKIPAGSRVRLIWQEPTKFVDGKSVGPAGERKLLAVLTTSTSAARKTKEGEVTVIGILSGVVSTVSETTLSVQDRKTGQMIEFGLGTTNAQRTRSRRIEPLPVLGLTPGRPVEVVARWTWSYEDGKLVGVTPYEAIAIWQDGP